MPKDANLNVSTPVFHRLQAGCGSCRRAGALDDQIDFVNWLPRKNHFDAESPGDVEAQRVRGQSHQDRRRADCACDLSR